MKIRNAFQSTFNSEPEVIAQAPGRVNLIGEHIDYSEGFVLPFAIDAVTQCAISKRRDDIVRIASANKQVKSSKLRSRQSPPSRVKVGRATFMELSGRSTLSLG